MSLKPTPKEGGFVVAFFYFWVLAGIEPYSLLSQSNTLTEYATNTVVLGGVEPPRTPSKGVGLPLADKTI